jgi:hypothetical protein
MNMKYIKYILLSFIVLTTITGLIFLFKDKPEIKKIIGLKKEIIVNKDSLIKLGMPPRIVEQYAFTIKTNKLYSKSFFISDPRENLIYFFDKKGHFVAKAPVIDGSDVQSKDKKQLEEAFKHWSEHAAEIGFKYNKTSKKYEDVTGRKRPYSQALVYAHIAKGSGKFFPQGMYKVPSVYHSEHFVGNCKNTFDVETMQGKVLSLAIHGLYKTPFRITTMKNMLAMIKTDFKDMSVPKSYRETMAKNLRNYTFNNSYGCINVPEGFLLLTEKLAPGSLLIVLGEEKEGYLVEI